MDTHLPSVLVTSKIICIKYLQLNIEDSPSVHKEKVITHFYC